jgi:Domain of unknown function (DUF4326)
MEINILNMHNHDNVENRKCGFFRVDRKSPVGNPFKMSDYPKVRPYDRDLVCDMYDESFFHGMLEDDKFKGYLQEMLTFLKDHGYVYLLCWCMPKRCHAETIKRWLEENY